ncbi:preprotein translocase subunit SecG [Feifania hominis]|uniref:Protein-export membrane protein SecG n=1 Tax=Feifania hominis TaxID=2763660 RepID=A0A926DE01_9FIRM|nr:preprotein translocase subunit SecG [Feifania hominis]MBC8536461.1 preprotein translocase subunit SecG [Feifania hominis]
MSTPKLIVSIIQLICAIAIIVAVMMQDDKEGGMSGVISGGSSESFFGRNKGKTKGAMLGKITILAGVVFVGLTLALDAFEKFGI